MFCFLFASSAHALSYGEWQASIVTAAEALMDAQNYDGSFDWVNDGDAKTSGSKNTQGATGRGLVAAYNATGNTTYLDAANRVADWLETNSTDVYNKDIEFLYELKAAGGNDYTDAAQTRTINYINEKITQKGGTGAEAVRSKYLNSTWTAASGTMNGTKLWMIGEWGHVAQLLGDTEIYTGYTGTDMANEMGSLLMDDYLTFDYANDVYGTLGLVGILEATAFGDKGTYGQDEIDALDDLLNMNTTSWQDTGYKTYALSLYDINDPTQLSNWINADYYKTGTGAYIESRGEALLGVASATVPEPGTMLLMGLGFTCLAGASRKFKQ